MTEPTTIVLPIVANNTSPEGNLKRKTQEESTSQETQSETRTTKVAKTHVEPEWDEQVKKTVKSKLQPLRTKLCTALQTILRDKINPSKKGIFFNVSPDDFETSFPLEYTISKKATNSKNYDGILKDAKPVLAGVRDQVVQQHADKVDKQQAGVLMGKAIAEFFYNCWKAVDANNKLKLSKPWLHVSAIFTIENDDQNFFDLFDGEWKTEGEANNNNASDEDSSDDNDNDDDDDEDGAEDDDEDDDDNPEDDDDE